MTEKNPQWGPYAQGPYNQGPYNQGPGVGGQQWGGYGQGPYGPGAADPGAPGAGQQRPRIDALDVLEGVLTDGLSLTNFTRIARASGSNFWLGAAIGAGLVVFLHRPDVKSAVSNVFGKAKEAATSAATRAAQGKAGETPKP